MTPDHDAPADPDAAEHPAPSLRLLYIEDDRLNAILFEEALRLQDGLELRVAVNARDALEQLAGWCPDLLVLDAQLPDMDGFALLRTLRERPDLRDTPAVMCSADTLPEDVQRAQDAGFEGFWPKPIDVAMILGDLRQRLTRRAAAMR